MTPLNRGLTTILAAATIATFVQADDEWQDIVRRLPASANIVAVINVKAVRESGRAKNTADIGGESFPSAVDLIVYATHLDPEAVAARQTTGLVQLNRKATLQEIAAEANGEVVNVGDMNIIDFGRRGRGFSLTPQLFGFGRQFNHQQLIRWKQFAETNQKVAIPTYLAEVLRKAPDAAIVAAVDMEHMIELRATCERVSQAKAAMGFTKDRVEGCSKLLTGLKGVRLAIRGKDLNQAEVRLDFGSEVGDEAGLVKAMFLEALDDLGAAIDEFREAHVSVDSRSVTLATQLSPGGLMRIMSIFAPPAPPTAPAPVAPRLEPNGVDVAATKRYFQAVDRYLEDLKRLTKNSDNYLRSATWHETYAERIEDLSPRYVDADAVKYSQSLLAKLRSLAWSLRGVVVEVKALESGAVNNIHAVGSLSPGGRYGSRWFTGGGGVSMNVDTNLSQLRTRQAEVIRQDAARRLKIWESIDQDRRAIIKLERDRYNVDLEKPGR